MVPVVRVERVESRAVSERLPVQFFDLPLLLLESPDVPLPSGFLPLLSVSQHQIVSVHRLCFPPRATVTSLPPADLFLETVCATVALPFSEMAFFIGWLLCFWVLLMSTGEGFPTRGCSSTPVEDDSPPARRRRLEEAFSPRASSSSSASPPSSSFSSSSPLTVSTPLERVLPRSPIRSSEIIVVEDSEDDGEDQDVPWGWYAHDSDDRSRLAGMRELDRETELARRWRVAIGRIQRVELGTLEDGELTEFERRVREERDGNPLTRDLRRSVTVRRAPVHRPRVPAVKTEVHETIAPSSSSSSVNVASPDPPSPSSSSSEDDAPLILPRHPAPALPCLALVPYASNPSHTSLVSPPISDGNSLALVPYIPSSSPASSLSSPSEPSSSPPPISSSTDLVPLPPSSLALPRSLEPSHGLSFSDNDSSPPAQTHIRAPRDSIEGETQWEPAWAPARRRFRRVCTFPSERAERRRRRAQYFREAIGSDDDEDGEDLLGSAPNRRRASSVRLDHTPPISFVPSPPEDSGRRVGSVRPSPAVFGGEDPQVSFTHRTLVEELLQAPTVSFSGREPHEAPLSGPDEEDGGFLEAVTALERYRSRPSSRGGVARAGLMGPVPRTREELGVEVVTDRPWGAVTRNAVSEWFPLMPEPGPENVCLACRAEVCTLLEQQQRRSVMSRDCAGRNDRSYNSALGVLPLLDWSESRLRTRLAFGNHTCGSGDRMCFPVSLFTPQGRPLPLRDVRHQGVRLRLFLHLLLPGNPMSWTASTTFSGVFPLFGMLRRFWGRTLWIRGGLVFMGFPPRSSRNPHVSHSLEVFAHSRFPQVLQYAPIEVTTTLVYGPRGDIFLYGASLQWEGGSADVGGHLLRYPREVTREQLLRALRTPVAPHSFASLRQGSWSVRLPEHSVETTYPTQMEASEEEGVPEEEEEEDRLLLLPGTRHRDCDAPRELA